MLGSEIAGGESQKNEPSILIPIIDNLANNTGNYILFSQVHLEMFSGVVPQNIVAYKIKDSQFNDFKDGYYVLVDTGNKAVFNKKYSLLMFNGKLRIFQTLIVKENLVTLCDDKESLALSELGENCFIFGKLIWILWLSASEMENNFQGITGFHIGNKIIDKNH